MAYFLRIYRGTARQYLPHPSPLKLFLSTAAEGMEFIVLPNHYQL